VASSRELHVVAREYSRDAIVIQNGSVLRTLHTAANPHDVKLAQPGCVTNHEVSVVAVAEGNMVSHRFLH
jgi:hypothetical protein